MSKGVVIFGKTHGVGSRETHDGVVDLKPAADIWAEAERQGGKIIAIVGVSGKGKSMMSRLTPDELAAMDAWRIRQRAEALSAPLNLMTWPGWVAVKSREAAQHASNAFWQRAR